MKNILVSACLLGLNCRYNGTGVLREEFEKYKQEYNLIPVCPEIFGGMMTPRDPAEIVNHRVVNSCGEDVTKYYEKGATEVLKLAYFYDCKLAILKERSPSCGSGQIYDGSFTGNLISGNGVTAELLMKNGITVIGETQIEGLSGINRI